MTQSPPRTVYSRLHSYLQTMQHASDLDTLADTWELFLIYHQRTWNRCEAHYAGQPFWGRLNPTFSARRKRETLLQYVHQARHADEHGLAPIAQAHPAFSVVSGGTLLGGSKIVGNGPSYLAPGSTATVIFNPATIVANPVINRGVTYDPPVLKGRPQPPVLQIAEAAIRFYEELFHEIDAAGGD